MGRRSRIRPRRCGRTRALNLRKGSAISIHLPIGLRARLAKAAVVGSAVLAAGSIAPAQASAAAVKPACVGDSVIVSMPLINENTGISDWSYGYVQLWYNYCTGNNWARIVSGLGVTFDMTLIAYNNASKYSGWYGCGDSTECTSGPVYSPNNPAGAFGAMSVNGVYYYAESDQPGANCTNDAVLPGKLTSCIPVPGELG